MELLIPGLILVGLMIWASTRIKKSAAAAFDAETVDTDQFVIRKPEGFLHVLNDDTGLAFRAYSKEFGKVGNKDVRRATIEIEKHADTNLETLRRKLESEAENVEAFDPYVDAGEKAAFMISNSIVDGGEYLIARKLVTRGNCVWEGRESVLSEADKEAEFLTESALNSFQVK